MGCFAVVPGDDGGVAHAQSIRQRDEVGGEEAGEYEHHQAKQAPTSSVFPTLLNSYQHQTLRNSAILAKPTDSTVIVIVVVIVDGF
jgi:hypothetical protein